MIIDEKPRPSCTDKNAILQNERHISAGIFYCTNGILYVVRMVKTHRFRTSSP
jgi:hypothetical protein